MSESSSSVLSLDHGSKLASSNEYLGSALNKDPGEFVARKENKIR